MHEPLDSDYLYIKKPKDLPLVQEKPAIGRLNLSSTLEELYSADPLDPVLVKIRNQCENRKGLCALPDRWFRVKIDTNSRLNHDLKPREVSVCAGAKENIGHDYLKTDPATFIMFSKIKGSVSSDPKVDFGNAGNLPDPNDQINEKITKLDNENTLIKVGDIDPRCSNSVNEPPTFLVSRDIARAMKEENFQPNKIFAKIYIP